MAKQIIKEYYPWLTPKKGPVCFQLIDTKGKPSMIGGDSVKDFEIVHFFRV